LAFGHDSSGNGTASSPEKPGEKAPGRDRLKSALPSSAAGTDRHVNVRWFFIGLLTLGAVVNYFDRTNLSIANPLIAAQFHLNKAEMGLLLSLFLWPYAVANVPAGWIVDRLGPRRTFSWALGLWSAVSVATAFAASYAVFAALRIFLGIAESPFFSAGVKVSHLWFEKQQRALATSIFNAGPQVASALGPPIMTLLMLWLGWQGMFIVIGALGFVVLALWLLVYRDPELRPQWARDLQEPQERATEQAGVAETTHMNWGSLFRYCSTWGMILGNFGVVYVYWVYLTWLPGYLEDDRHLTILKTGFVASIPYLVGMVGVLLGGYISDLLIGRGMSAINARRIPIIAGALIVAIAVVPAVYVSSVTLSIILLSIGFFGSSIPSGVIWTLATDVAPRRYVASLGAIQNAGGYIGGALAPLVTGIVTQSMGSFNLAFVIASIFAVFAAISYFVILKGPIEPEESEVEVAA
jgi:sugar phosphate permease